MQIEFTKDEVAQVKRAVVLLSELAAIGVKAGNLPKEPVKIMEDRVALFDLIRKVEAVAK